MDLISQVHLKLSVQLRVTRAGRGSGATHCTLFLLRGSADRDRNA